MNRMNMMKPMSQIGAQFNIPNQQNPIVQMPQLGNFNPMQQMVQTQYETNTTPTRHEEFELQNEEKVEENNMI